MEGLPRSHARLLKKRVHTLRSTLRQKRSQEGIGTERGDVRNIFSGQESTNHVAGNGHNLTNHVTANHTSNHYLTPGKVTNHNRAVSIQPSLSGHFIIQDKSINRTLSAVPNSTILYLTTFPRK